MKKLHVWIWCISLLATTQVSAQDSRPDYSTDKLKWTINAPLKASFGPHTYQTINVNINTDLNFFRIKPYYSLITGIEGGFNYQIVNRLYAGLRLGIVGTHFEQYNYAHWEYRNLYMIPIYSTFRYDIYKDRNAIYAQADFGYNFVSQYFYSSLGYLSVYEQGGLLYGASLGYEADYFNHQFFISLGYEVNENNVTMFLENMPLEWVGNATGTRKFKEFQNTLVLKLGMNI